MNNSNNREVVSIWNSAASIDPTLRIRPRHLDAIRRRRIRPEPWSRNRLFSQMARGYPVIFHDFRVPILARKQGDPIENLLKVVQTGFAATETARVRVGRSRQLRHLTVPEVLRRWRGGRSVVSVTDLHIRGSRFEKAVDIRGLSDFNLLIRGSERTAYQEMMTLVVSSAGAMTDSHSDDPDGSNHSFVGKKLWLAWETFEGRANGLQDVERDTVPENAAFDMDTFLSLRSACWFIVETGSTLFLPGRLTHKVITLERYLGIGSFYVALPSCLDSLTRWYTRGPLWALNDRDGSTVGLIDEIADDVAKKITSLQKASVRVRERWGFDELLWAARRFKTAVPKAQRDRLMITPAFARVIAAIEAA